jgi:NAD-dependent deacetylase
VTGLDELGRVRSWLAEARQIAILTGAGMSAESGVPTFRDAQTGLWAQFNPEELATESAFRANPQRVWDWYAFRREMIARVAPNAGHLAIAGFQQRHPGRLTLITQNVDGLHQKAGSMDTLALHGNIFEDQWLGDCARARRPDEVCDPASAQPGRPPRCAECGNVLRPGVVWFGESLPRAVLETAEKASRDCDLMLVVGTSGVVYPAAGLARTARRSGAKVLVINPEPTELDDVAHTVLRGKAAELLPALLCE